MASRWTGFKMAWTSVYGLLFPSISFNSRHLTWTPFSQFRPISWPPKSSKWPPARQHNIFRFINIWTLKSWQGPVGKAGELQLQPRAHSSSACFCLGFRLVFPPALDVLANFPVFARFFSFRGSIGWGGGRGDNRMRLSALLVPLMLIKVGQPNGLSASDSHARDLGRLIGICSRQLEYSQAKHEDKEQQHGSWHFKAIEDCICVCISPVQ